MRAVRLLCGLSILTLISCYTSQDQEKKVDTEGCAGTIVTYFDIYNQLGYWPPSMSQVQQLCTGDSINCEELKEAYILLEEKAGNRNSLLEILNEPHIDTFLAYDEQTVYRAMIIDGQIPYVRMLRIDKLGRLTYKVAKYVDSIKSNVLLTDSTVSLFVDNHSWLELNKKIKESYFWDLTSYEYDPVYYTGDSWFLEGSITKNGKSYYHNVNRLNPPENSSYRKCIKFMFNLVRR